jgi:hypothetical protein
MAGHDYTIPMELPEGFKCVECPEPVEGLAWVYMLLMRNEMQCFYSLHSRVEPTTTIRKRPTCPFILNSLFIATVCSVRNADVDGSATAPQAYPIHHTQDGPYHPFSQSMGLDIH